MPVRAALRPKERDACLALLRERNAHELEVRQRRSLDAELELRRQAEKRTRLLDFFTEGKIQQREYDLQLAGLSEQEQLLEAAR